MQMRKYIEHIKMRIQKENIYIYIYQGYIRDFVRIHWEKKEKIKAHVPCTFERTFVEKENNEI